MVSINHRKTFELESETSLTRRARHGDARALARLLEIHYAGMLRLAMKYSTTPDSAHDVLQESCIKVMQHLSQLREDARFSSWMSKIVINTARIHHRKNRRFIFLDSVGFITGSKQACPEEQLDNRQRLSQVETVLRNGRADDYQLFIRRYVVGQSDQTISHDMGLSIPALKTRVHRARSQLRRTIQV